MLRTITPGAPVYFIDQGGFVRSGAVIDGDDKSVVIRKGHVLIQPRERCYADRPAALRTRANQLAEEIAVKQKVHASLLAELHGARQEVCCASLDGQTVRFKGCTHV